MKRLWQRFFMDRISLDPTFAETETATYSLRVAGVDMQLTDFKESTALRSIFKELSRDELGILGLHLPVGAKIIDIGGHVGSLSIYLAKRFPQAEIHCFEAFDANFEYLLRNLEANDVENVVARNLAVTADGRPFSMMCGRGHSGGGTGCSACSDGDGAYTVDSIELDTIYEELGGCDLLKIDCEGAEHEILKGAQCLDQVGHLIGEFHMNDHLREQGHDSGSLLELVRQKVQGHVGVKCIEMCR